jgi:hypothetical protein
MAIFYRIADEWGSFLEWARWELKWAERQLCPTKIKFTVGRRCRAAQIFRRLLDDPGQSRVAIAEYLSLHLQQQFYQSRGKSPCSQPAECYAVS